MPRPPSLALRLPAIIALALPPAVANAQTPSAPPDEQPPSPLQSAHFRAELTGGFGLGSNRVASGQSLNTYGAAAGARLGYTFAFPLYLGLRYDHFFGSSEQYPLPLVALTTYHVGATFLGFALGAELRLGPAYLRPELGVGFLAVSSGASCSPVAGSFADLASQICAANTSSSTSWALSAVPGLPIGLHVGRFYGFVEPEYYLRKSADGYAVVAAIGAAL